MHKPVITNLSPWVTYIYQLCHTKTLFLCTKKAEITPHLWVILFSLLLFKTRFLSKCRNVIRTAAAEGLMAWLQGIVSTASNWLGKHQPGFRCAESLILCDVLPCAVICRSLGCRVNTARCVDGDGRQMDHVSSRSRKWELEGSCYQASSFLQMLHGPKLKPCVLLPCWSLRTTGPAGRRYGLPNNIWFQEAFTPSLLPLLFESPFCAALLVSLGGSNKWFLSVLGLQRCSPPLWSFQSRLGARWMWLGKYSSVSPDSRVISCCHRLTRSRLRKIS